MDAEREMLKRVTALFLRDRVGETFTGVVSGVSDFGFWVELREVMAEGLIRLSTLHDDYYTLIPERHELRGSRTGRRIQLGQTLAVRLMEVNMTRLEVNLEVVADRQNDQPRKGQAKRTKGGASNQSGRSRSGKNAQQSKVPPPPNPGNRPKKIFLDDPVEPPRDDAQTPEKQSPEKRRGKGRSGRRREKS